MITTYTGEEFKKAERSLKQAAQMMPPLDMHAEEEDVKNTSDYILGEIKALQDSRMFYTDDYYDEKMAEFFQRLKDARR